jgi:hypothetical protein
MSEIRRDCCGQENASIAARWIVSSLAVGHFQFRCEDRARNSLLVGVYRGTLVLPLL